MKISGARVANYHPAHCTTITMVQLHLRQAAAVRRFHVTAWHESEVIVDRKSRFQARAVSVTSPLHVPIAIDELLTQNKHIRKASHPAIYAYRVQSPNLVEQGFKDCGEKGAGTRLLLHLQKHNVVNRLVIVTRWYGGMPLGLLRFRHIAKCAFDSLRRSGVGGEGGLAKGGEKMRRES